jgi:hypothetical protein
VKPQKKPVPGVTNEPIAPSSEDKEDEEKMNRMMLMRKEKRVRKKLKKFGLLLLLHPRGEARMIVMCLSHPAPKGRSTRRSRNSHGSKELCFAWELIFAKSNTTPTFKTSISLTTKA